MLRDLERDPIDTDGAEADVVVIGGGIAGLVLARKLRAQNMSCIVLETGALDEAENDLVYNDIEIIRRSHSHATRGRRRGLGGTSLRWAGALIPFTFEGFAPHRHPGHPGWPIGPESIHSYLVEAERLFDLDHSRYDASQRCFRCAKGFIPREAKRPRFHNRNLAKLCWNVLVSPNGPIVWLNAHVQNFVFQNGQIRSVSSSSPNGRTLTVRGREFVICAGAIESTRLLLMLDDKTNGHAIAGRAHLGHYLQDHLSMPFAHISTDTPEQLNALLGFRFDKRGVIRDFRFERHHSRSGGGYVHIAPEYLGSTGFEAARLVMRGVQRGKVDVNALLTTFRHMPYLVRLAWWRFVRKRLLWSKPAKYQVHVVVEQVPKWDNRIYLSERVDIFGNPIAVLDWDYSSEDIENIRSICNDFDVYWSECQLTKYGNLDWRFRPESIDSDKLDLLRDINHPVGTTRMAASANEGVVDSNLRVFGVDNLSVAATSAFPEVGSVNPTMTLILLTLRLAEKLKN